jgi:hypothetical protein
MCRKYKKAKPSASFLPGCKNIGVYPWPDELAVLFGRD